MARALATNRTASLVCVSAALIAASTIIATAQQELPSTKAAQAKLRLPYGPVTTLRSPNGSHVLYGIWDKSDVNRGPELWIEDRRTGRRTKLLSLGSTAEAEWSSGGTAFFVVDRMASDTALAYIYDSATLERRDIAERIRSADPGTERFANAHRYFLVERWAGLQDVMVRFRGHTDARPIICFDLRYRVSRAGFVHKLSEQVSPVTPRGCE